ncbi:ribonuclease P protein component [Guyparkeria hydrothermalis]|uniref:ribonuclease P protein component n=1 Tax=Guyparkeria TaxID=2035712 RepID=UPI0010AB8A8C|nr:MULTISPECIES: ribonuclease P protein component [Guyparkeria]MCL7750498.1 ribonuclease P protein component [Guyparkeria hydrothermalis]TKA88926.1 ribonuclease P protein component [Guyparkeria sp. SB14A]
MTPAAPEAPTSGADSKEPAVIRGGRFPRSARLLSGSDYQRVMRGGNRVHTANLMLALHANPGGEPRLGLAVSRKRVRLAHERNRVKRVAREQFRLSRAELPGMDVVVLAKSGVDGLSMPELHRQMRQALNKASRKCAAS